jgi:hypothetical protein
MNPIEILKSWDKYFNNANLPSILNLYDTRSILIPTFSSEILSDKRQIKEYFVNMIKEQEVSVEIRYNSIYEQKVGENIYLLNGNYIFKLQRNKNIHARFTFLIKPLSDNPIKHHHSSRIINN